MSMNDFDRLRAAMKASRGEITGRTPEQVDEDILRERLANLEPPELGETIELYVARMIREHGTTYNEAATARYHGAQEREVLAAKAAARELRRFMLPKRRGRKPAA